MIGVYVAGASRDWQRAREFMDRVRAHQRMRITHDWTVSVEAATVDDSELSANQRVGFARTDLAGVARCDALVVLLDTTVASVGRWVELGYALRMCDEVDQSTIALGPRIIVSGGQRKSIFTAPGLVDFEHAFATVGWEDEDAFASLAQHAQHTEPIELRTRPDDLLRCPECESTDVGDSFGLLSQRCYQCGITWYAS